MTKDKWSAVVLLLHVWTKVHADPQDDPHGCHMGCKVIHHAIRHLAYPDRNVYPKTRRATKGAPIVRH